MATFSSGALNGAADALPYLHSKALKNLGAVPTVRIGTFDHTTTDFGVGTVIQMVPVFKGEMVVDMKLIVPVDCSGGSMTFDIGETADSPATEDTLVGVTTGADPDRYTDAALDVQGAFSDDVIGALMGEHVYTADDTIDIVTAGEVFNAAPTGASAIKLIVTVIGG